MQQLLARGCSGRLCADGCPLGDCSPVSRAPSVAVPPLDAGLGGLGVWLHQSAADASRQLPLLLSPLLFSPSHSSPALASLLSLSHQPLASPVASAATMRECVHDDDDDVFSLECLGCACCAGGGPDLGTGAARAVHAELG